VRPRRLPSSPPSNETLICASGWCPCEPGSGRAHGWARLVQPRGANCRLAALLFEPLLARRIASGCLRGRRAAGQVRSLHMRSSSREGCWL
jgi:hypothetical protein